MNRQQILALIRSPETMNARKLQQVERLLGQYPYFQGAHVLAARGKYRMRRPDARRNMTLASLYVTDKDQLKKFMSRKVKTVSVRPPGKYSPTKSRSPRKPPSVPTTPKPSTYVEKTLPNTERERLVGEVMSEVQALRHNMQQFEYSEEARERRTRDHIDYSAPSPPSNEKKDSQPFDTEVKDSTTKSQLSSEKKDYFSSYEAEESRKRNLPQQPQQQPQPSFPSPVQVIFGSNLQQPQYPYGQGGSYNLPPSGTPYGGYTPSFFSPLPMFPPFVSAYPYVSPMYSLLSPVHPYGSPFPPSPPLPSPLQAQSPAQSSSSTDQSSSSYLPFSSTEKSQSVHSKTSTPPSQLEQKDIIERFIKNVSGKDTTFSSEDVKGSSSDPLGYSSNINDDICSEELAELYRNQGHDVRAIEIYHRLCEKYPEKSAYFVSKIREIKK